LLKAKSSTRCSPRSNSSPQPLRLEPADRVLTTILLAKPIGDLEASHHVLSHHGRLCNITEGCMLATFDAPGQAIRCAAAIRDDAAAHGAHLRIGIHTGEVDRVAEDINGITLEIAANVAARADAGDVLVSRTVKDLVVGSGISFAHRGSYPLTATGDRWPLFAVTGA
jgi:class 3 adenylate cyclase